MSTDLLGHPIADPPPMTAPLPWRVFQMNDITEWVMARTEREAIAFYVDWCNEMGDPRTEAEMRKGSHIFNVRELTDAELQKHNYDDGANHEDRYTFADELANLAKRATVPMFFASTEY
jgi:hypothetical protein